MMYPDPTALLLKTAEEQLDVCHELIWRAYRVRHFLAAERRELWDAMFVTVLYDRSLGLAVPTIRSGRSTLRWTSQLCSSLVDDAAYGRGLLTHALRLAAESGLVANKEDAKKLYKLLGRGMKCRDSCVVAYLDYVGASDGFDWRQFQALWNVMAAEAIDLGFRGYYWRSSDSFYFACSLREGANNDSETRVCKDFLEFLLHIQTKRCLKGEWMWSIGATLEKGALVGDIFLPGAEGPMAGSAMKKAIDRLRGGGALVVNKEFKEAVRDSDGKFKALRGDDKKFFFYDRLATK